MELQVLYKSGQLRDIDRQKSFTSEASFDSTNTAQNPHRNNQSGNGCQARQHGKPIPEPSPDPFSHNHHLRRRRSPSGHPPNPLPFPIRPVVDHLQHSNHLPSKSPAPSPEQSPISSLVGKSTEIQAPAAWGRGLRQGRGKGSEKGVRLLCHRVALPPFLPFAEDRDPAPINR